MVSVLMITYNHDLFIAQAIESVLMQEVNFEMELVIGEDCSTDSTRAICADFACKNPQKIRLLSSERNHGMMPNFLRTLNSCRGKYVALCEGDDYWTSSLKLQKQVNFLESNLDCSLCFHPSHYTYANKQGEDYIHRPKYIPKTGKFELNYAILHGGYLITTNSMLFRREHVINIPQWMSESPVGDIPLMLLLGTRGRLGYIDEVMSVYRKVVSNSWSSNMQCRVKKHTHFHAILKMWSDFDNWTNQKYHYAIMKKKLVNRWHFFKINIKEVIMIFKEE